MFDGESAHKFFKDDVNRGRTRVALAVQIGKPFFLRNVEADVFQAV